MKWTFLLQKNFKLFVKGNKLKNMPQRDDSEIVFEENFYSSFF